MSPTFSATLMLICSVTLSSLKKDIIKYNNDWFDIASWIYSANRVCICAQESHMFQYVSFLYSPTISLNGHTYRFSKCPY